MCGILGGNIENWNYEKGIMSIKHRGPDAQKVEKFLSCTLAFTRLSIIDLSMNAMQPMTTNDGLVTIVFNGEIYGYNKLKSELKNRYPFKTTSDTEVILYAYLEYGDNFIDYIDGMFAITIYDRRQEILKLYRDRYGIKPLYYYYKDNEFAFASEIKALVTASVNKKWEVDNTAILDFLCYQYIPEPKTIYNDIYKLNPACYIFYDLRKRRIVKKDRYWRLHVCTKAEGKRKKIDIIEDIRYLITESVKEQMVADVKVGTFLSGGIDSSIITYVSNKYNKNIEAFSIGFKEKEYDEIDYSKIFVDRYNINQKIKILKMQNIKNLKGKLKEWYDEPFADTSAYPTYEVSKFAKENVKVVLTGDGSDELFGGYERYAIFSEQLKGKPCLQLSIINKFLDTINFETKNLKSQLSIYSHLVGIFNKDLEKKWKNKYGISSDYDTKWYLKKYYNPDLPPLTRMRYLDFKTYLPSDILTKVDRTSMSVSLEARVPFLNRKIVEYTFGLAESECCSSACLKQILKEAYAGIIPNEILYRKKKGFSIPNKYIHVSSNCNSKYEEILKREWPKFF